MSNSSRTDRFRFVPAAPSQPPPQDLTVAQAMALAAQHQSQGRLQESEQLLQQILRQHPDHAFALHLLGVIAHQVGKQPVAAELIQKAIRINGNVALFHANLCEIMRQLKRPDDAVAHGARAVALDPQLVAAHANLGIAYFDRKDYARAESCQQRALAIAPNFAPALNNLGSIERERKHNAQALDWYNKASAADPNYLEPLSNLGALLLEEDRIPEAAAALDRALQLNPNYAEALCNRGGVHLAREEKEAALACYRRALALRKDYLEAQIGLANVLRSLEDLPAAEQAAMAALRIDARHAKAHSVLGSIQAELTQPEAAERSYNEALAIDPECDDALLGLGHLCMELGRMEQAEALFRRALAYQPDNLAARIHIAQVKKAKAGDDNFAALLEEEKNMAALSDNRKLSLHFALGKCYDDSGDYANAFPHFLAGCRLKRAQISYDEEVTARQFSDLAAIFDRDTIARLRGAGDPSGVPVFVLGMPRSGTTLTEQIIASHPDVYGAGELSDLLRIAEHGLSGSSPGPATAPWFPDKLRALDHDTLNAWGSEYVAGLRQRAPGARRITDKMPSNYLAVGLIHLMLPNAKIIHVNRNPVDTCLSCYSRLFNRKQEHTYDLAELGRYYVHYARLMAHWRKVLPAGAFLDLQYEDIVADQEAQARKLIAYCGLAWHDACLDFHTTRRAIRTASVTQVRQPIYTTSVERWRNYEAFLQPLLTALGDLVPAHPATGR